MKTPQFALSLAVSLLAVAPLCAADVFTPPAPSELTLKDVSFAPGAPAVVLDWTIERDDDRNFENHHVRIKVLTEEGKKFANVEVPYRRDAMSIRKLQARTIQSDGSIRPFDGQAYDKLLVKVHRYDISAKTFTLPDVRVGSILEYAYTIEWANIGTLARWPIERDIPVLHEHYSFRPWQGPLALMYMAHGLPDGVQPQLVSGRFEVDLKNITPFEVESLAPPEDLIKRQITFFYQVDDAKKNEYWNKVCRALSDRIEEFIKQRPAITSAAKEITAGATTDEEKVRKIYARVQQLRDLSYEREKSEQEAKREKLRENKRAEDVLTNGYGLSSELNKLFIALARAAGMAADPVLLCDRAEPLVKDVPDFSQFDHIAAVVTLDGKRRYFDPGVPHLPFGALRWDNAYTDALIDGKAKAEWVLTNDVPTSVKRNATMHVDGDALSGTVHVELTGQAALRHRLDLRFDDETAQKKTFEDEAKKWFPDGSTVKLTKLSGMSGVDEPVAIDYDVTIANVVSLTGSRAIIPLSLFESTAKNPFAAAHRKHPFYIDFTYDITDAVTLQLPDGYKVESLPDAVNHDAGVLKYRNQSKIVDGSIAFSRTLKFGTAFINEESYPVLRGFMSDVTTADQASASLRKK